MKSVGTSVESGQQIVGKGIRWGEPVLGGSKIFSTMVWSDKKGSLLFKSIQTTRFIFRSLRQNLQLSVVVSPTLQIAKKST